MADAFSVKLDLAAVNAAVDQIGSAALKEVRPAAQAAAQILYDEVLTRVPSSLKGHWFHGTSFKSTGKKYWFDAGSLRRAIYQAFSKDNSSETRATYHISWNRTKAPYGHMVEFGTSRSPAKQFLRNSWDAKIADATRVAEARYVKGVQEAIEAHK